MATGKLVVIGLELGDGELIHRWAQEGRLPALQKLRERGIWGWLKTSAEELHISAWPTIYTGASPGEHGVYFTHQPAPGLQGYQRFHPGIYGRPTLWKLLDAAGRRTAVLDPPYSHPEDGYRGTYIYDWGSWAHYLAPGSLPPAALKQLEKSVGSYPLGLEANDLGWGPLAPRETATRLITALRAKTAATCWLLQQNDPALVLSVFGETHVAGHYCVTPDQALMLEIYQELDRSIAAIAAAAGSDATLVILSGDRTGVNHAGWHLLPEVLEKLGYLGTAKSAPMQAMGDAAPAAKKSRDPVKILRDMLPKGLRKSLARMLLPTALRDKLAQRVDTADTDWSRTRVYCLPTDLEGYLRVNLKGREPQGTVNPGAEYEALLDDLSAALLELRDPATDHAIVRQVIRTDRAYPGARRAYLPDLIVQWSADRPITAAQSPRVGVVSSPSPDPRPGTHTGPGFVLAAGPGIAAGQTLEGGDILDVAPTLLSFLGVTPPQEMHGKVWRELQAA
jgi:predicted AlkP superfamily phosphohydrolase/phosphomutase